MRKKSASCVAPLVALGAGFAAGIPGSVVQDVFFRVTGRLAPETPKDAFVPPEEIQRTEQALETVARRFVEQMMRRGPLSEEAKAKGARLVHYGFGGTWGALYGLTRETFPVVGTLSGTLGFGVLVWAVSDNGILPAFRLAAGPRAYPLEIHAYAVAAHLAYAVGLFAAYRPLAQRPWLGALAAVVARRRRSRIADRRWPVLAAVRKGTARARKEVLQVQRAL
jgi:hypothetical protein